MQLGYNYHKQTLLKRIIFETEHPNIKVVLEWQKLLSDQPFHFANLHAINAKSCFVNGKCKSQNVLEILMHYLSLFAETKYGFFAIC